MSGREIDGRLDQRFSEEGADAATWPATEALLEAAELYWITTVRSNGHPHTTPLVGVWHEGAFWFCTGPAGLAGGQPAPPAAGGGGGGGTSPLGGGGGGTDP